MAFFKQENIYFYKQESNDTTTFICQKICVLWNRKLLPTEEFGNILAFNKESKRKVLSHSRQFY